MQSGHDGFETLTVVFDDADHTRERSRFPRIEIIEQSFR
jgi:hypothetical protein